MKYLIGFTAGCVVAALVYYIASKEQNMEKWRPSLALINAIGMVESGNNPRSINTAEQAYGIYQIRQCVLDDVNSHLKEFFTTRDCMNPTTAKLIMLDYWHIYAPISNEEAARMWNGGPHGATNVATREYWERVSKILNREV